MRRRFRAKEVERGGYRGGRCSGACLDDGRNGGLSSDDLGKVRVTPEIAAEVAPGRRTYFLRAGDDQVASSDVKG